MAGRQQRGTFTAPVATAAAATAGAPSRDARAASVAATVGDAARGRGGAAPRAPGPPVAAVSFPGWGPRWHGGGGGGGARWRAGAGITRLAVSDVNRGTRIGWGGGGGAGCAGGYCSGGGDWRDGGAAVPRAAGMAWGPPIQANGPRAGLLGRGERGGGGGEWEVVWSGRGGVGGVGGGVPVGGVGGGCGQRDGVGARACWRWGWMGLAGTAR